ncbi:MAG: hypothetical protein JWR03_486 [Cohnella sp.]|jgi:hypothetical protein|nr:hypothetical protein [Cohnella sp.]
MAFWFVVAAAVIVGLIWLAAASRIRVRVRYSRSGHFDELVIIVRALHGIVGYQVTIPEIMIRGRNLVYRRESSASIGNMPVTHKSRWRNGAGVIRRLWNIYRHNPQIQVWIRQTLKKVACTRFRLDFRVGTGDPPSTAMLSGLLWTVYGCAVAVTGHATQLKTTPHGSVEPVYEGTEFGMVWEADFRIRFGTAVLSVFKLGLRAIRTGRSFRYWRQGLAGP